MLIEAISRMPACSVSFVTVGCVNSGTLSESPTSGDAELIGLVSSCVVFGVSVVGFDSSAGGSGSSVAGLDSSVAGLDSSAGGFCCSSGVSTGSSVVLPLEPPDPPPGIFATK